jgi:DNA-binding response OmpR family regulator
VINPPERQMVWLVEHPAEEAADIRRSLERCNVASEEWRVVSAEAALGEGLREPDLILVAWAGHSGQDDFVAKLRARHGAIHPPIVCLGGEEAEEEAAALRRAGANSAVALPAHPQHRQEAMLDLLIYWLLLEGHTEVVPPKVSPLLDGGGPTVP